MRAKTPEHYRAAWESHIQNLTTLALAADIPYDEYRAARDRLLQWLDKAMENEWSKEDE